MSQHIIEASFLATGRTAGYEESYMKITIDYFITHANNTATVALTSKMEVKRDSLASSSVGIGNPYLVEPYITIDDTTVKLGTPKLDISGTYVTIGTASHTVTYDAWKSKTVTIEAGFSADTTKLKGLVIPVSDYVGAAAYLTATSGADSLTFPAQVEAYAIDVNYLVNGEWKWSGDSSVGTFDVYINNAPDPVAEGVTDYGASYPAGTTYRIVPTVTDPTKCVYVGYVAEYPGINCWPDSGTFPAHNFSVGLNFRSLFTITFNPNGADTSEFTREVTYNSTDYWNINSSLPTRVGYAFTGYYTQPTGGTQVYDDKGACVSGSYWDSNKRWIGTDDLTLYAQWKINTYTVSYDANGGSDAPESQTKTYNIALDLSLQEPVREGHTFLGWSTSPSASEAEYVPGATFTSNANTTLYAVWVEDADKLAVKVNGAWKTGKVLAKIKGQWHESTGVYTKVDGTWKQHK